MRASIFVSVAAFAAAAYAQESSSQDPFPQTAFLQQTDSRGVVTGQPAAATSIPNQPPADTNIPAVDTDVGAPASIPAVAPGINTIQVPGTGNTTRTLVVSANNSTTVVLGNPTSSGASGSNSAKPTGTDGKPISGEPSRTGSGASTGAQSTGAAATMRAVAGSVVGMGAFVAAFL